MFLQKIVCKITFLFFIFLFFCIEIIYHIEIIWLWKMFLQKIFCKITFLFFIFSDCTKLHFCYLSSLIFLIYAFFSKIFRARRKNFWNFDFLKIIFLIIFCSIEVQNYIFNLYFFWFFCIQIHLFCSRAPEIFFKKDFVFL